VRSSSARCGYDAATQELVVSGSSGEITADVDVELIPRDPGLATIVLESVAEATVEGTLPPASLPTEVVPGGMRYGVRLEEPTAVVAGGETFFDIAAVFVRVDMGSDASADAARTVTFSVQGPPRAELPFVLAGQAIEGGPGDGTTRSSAIGSAHLLPAEDGVLRVGNLGVASGDGVRFDLEATWVAEAAIEPAAVAQRNQSDLEFLVRLTLSQDPEATPAEATLRLAGAGGVPVVQADLSAISSAPDVTVERHVGGGVVESIVVPHGATALGAPGTPTSMGVTVDVGSQEHVVWMAFAESAPEVRSSAELLVARAPASNTDHLVEALELSVGLWRAIRVTGIGSESSVDAPGVVNSPGLTLWQPSPNPFNPRTVVRFRMERAGVVRLEVHDLRGRRIDTLLAGWVEAGEHRRIWDGTDPGGLPVASGIYLMRLVGPGSPRTKKVTLVR
jgi:hypothetical protein